MWQCLIVSSFTYSLHLLSSDILDSLHQAGRLVRLARVDNAGADEVESRLPQLGLIEGVELGVGNSLGNVLLGYLAVGNALQGLDSSLSTLTDRSGSTRQLNSEETSIGVRDIRGGEREAGDVRRGLGEEAVSGRPLDGRLTTQQGGQHGNLGLGRSVAGAGEGDDHGVSTGVACPLLTAVVLGSLRTELLAGLGRGRYILEELANPLGQVLGSSAISHESQVGLHVDSVREAGNVLLVHVLAIRRGRRGVDRGAEAIVEGDGVGVVESDSRDIVVEAVLLESQNALNVLMEFVGCNRVNSKLDRSL